MWYTDQKYIIRYITICDNILSHERKMGLFVAFKIYAYIYIYISVCFYSYICIYKHPYLHSCVK